MNKALFSAGTGNDDHKYDIIYVIDDTKLFTPVVTLSAI